MDKSGRLHAILTACRGLGAEVDRCRERGYFTATVWEDSGLSGATSRTRAVQKQIQEKTAQYPGHVCCCFDSFSTLAYTV